MPLKWVVTAALLPGIVATAVLVFNPLSDPEKPRWLTVAAWTGFLYVVLAVLTCVWLTLDLIGTELS